MIVSDYVNDSFTDLKQFEDELTEEGIPLLLLDFLSLKCAIISYR